MTKQTINAAIVQDAPIPLAIEELAVEVARARPEPDEEEEDEGTA